jgi:protein gp37
MERVNHLETFSEGHKFLSVEPLKENIELDLSGIRCPSCGSVNVYQDNPARTPAGTPPYYCDDCGEWEGEEPAKLIEWVIVGAETGPGAKSPEPEWVQSIINQCRDAGIPIFLKNNLNWPMKIQEYPWEKEKAK